uniref:thioredoxin family protein n=1 Tax=Caballeronia sp. LjRoot34 TaxID=3342325 RepID=UPI003F4FCA80
MNRLYGNGPVPKGFSTQSIVGAPAQIAVHKRSSGGGLISLTAATFDQYVGASDLPVVIHFWARWCSVSKTMSPHFSAGARKLAGRALFARVETDQETSLARRYGIECVPTLVLLRNGREIERHCGAMTAGQLDLWLQPHLRKTT